MNSQGGESSKGDSQFKSPGFFFTNEQFAALVSIIRKNDTKKTFSKCKARFGGSNNVQDLDRFIAHVRAYKSSNQMTDDEAISDFGSLLEGPVKKWWSRTKYRTLIWNEALALLAEKFDPLKPDHELFLRMFSEKQQFSESIGSFVARKMVLLEKISFENIEKVKLDMVYALLHPSYKRIIPREAVSNLTELMNCDFFRYDALDIPKNESNRENKCVGTSTLDTSIDLNELDNGWFSYLKNLTSDIVTPCNESLNDSWVSLGTPIREKDLVFKHKNASNVEVSNDGWNISCNNISDNATAMANLSIEESGIASNKNDENSIEYLSNIETTLGTVNKSVWSTLYSKNEETPKHETASNSAKMKTKEIKRSFDYKPKLDWYLNFYKNNASPVEIPKGEVSSPESSSSAMTVVPNKMSHKEMKMLRYMVFQNSNKGAPVQMTQMPKKPRKKKPKSNRTDENSQNGNQNASPK